MQLKVFYTVQKENVEIKNKKELIRKNIEQ